MWIKIGERAINLERARVILFDPDKVTVSWSGSDKCVTVFRGREAEVFKVAFDAAVMVSDRTARMHMRNAYKVDGTKTSRSPEAVTPRSPEPLSPNDIPSGLTLPADEVF